MSQTKSELLRQ